MIKTYCFQNFGGDILHQTQKLKNYIISNDCKEIVVDITALNFIDTAKVCVLVSAYHFGLYPDGKIKWLVKDEIAKSCIAPMMLSNIEIEIVEEITVKEFFHAV